MARVAIQLPQLLGAMCGDRLRFDIDAATVADAFDRLRREHPQLALHLFDESGALRRHVLCFVNEVNSRWLDALDEPLVDGAELMFMQAVTGG
ncbi:MAG: MoaD/ThiS family protein [Phycisphaerales bacterium]|nr:MoaD/ThiS family protein [Phycisphaerales bacterium]